MRKRWLVGIAVVVAVAAAALAFPAVVYMPLGLVRHEAFFAGKPTNYWDRAVRQEGFLGHSAPASDVGKELKEGGAAAVPVLCQLAESPDGNVRLHALNTLSLIGPDARAAAPVLVKTLRTETSSARFMAAGEALVKADPAVAAETLSAVMRDHDNPGGRAWSLALLLNLAPEGRGTLPTLKELLHDPDGRLRVEAAHVLWRMKEPDGPLVEALRAELGSDSDVGVQAIAVLGEMGPAAKPAVPTLRKLLEKPDLPDDGKRWGPPHRVAILRCLRKTGPAAGEAVPAVIPLLASGNRTVRTEAVRALGPMGGAAKPALAALRETLRDQDAEVRAAATESLRLLDQAAEPAPDPKTRPKG